MPSAPASVAAVGAEEQILVAAREEFVGKGFAGARMAAIAERAGINKGLLHYYFRSKDQLFQRVFREAIGLMIPTIYGALSGPEPVAEKLDRLVDRYHATLLANPHVPVFIVHELATNRERLAAHLAERLGPKRAIADFFAQVRAEAEVGAIAPVDPLQLLLHVMSLVAFPFVARDFISATTATPTADYERALTRRAPFVKDLLRHVINPDNSPS